MQFVRLIIVNYIVLNQNKKTPTFWKFMHAININIKKIVGVTTSVQYNLLDSSPTTKAIIICEKTFNLTEGFM